MTEFFKTLMGRKFYEADVPRLVNALERIADALEASGRPAGATDQRVKVAVYSNDPGAYADLVTAPDGVIVSYAYHEREADEPQPVTQLSEAKVGAAICCDDPECIQNKVRPTTSDADLVALARAFVARTEQEDDCSSDDLIDTGRALAEAILLAKEDY